MVAAIPGKCLGKAPAKFSRKTLRTQKYLNLPRLPTPPESTSRRSSILSWEMYGNDQIGDCAIAGPAHQDTLWSIAGAGLPYKATIAQVVADYSAMSGYDPNSGANDNGCVLLDVMNRWRVSGIAGRSIKAYSSIHQPGDGPIDHALVCASSWLFGSLTLGFMLPQAWQETEDWQAPSRHHRFGKWAPGSWGGHCVPIVDYDPQWVYIVSWGKIVRCSWTAIDAYCDEMYVPYSTNWLDTVKKVAPSGFDEATLLNDLAAL